MTARPHKYPVGILSLEILTYYIWFQIAEYCNLFPTPVPTLVFERAVVAACVYLSPYQDGRLWSCHSSVEYLATTHRKKDTENKVSNLLVIMQANPHSYIDQLQVNPCQAKF